MFFNESNVLKTPRLIVNSESLNNGYKIPNIIHFTFINKNLPIEVLRVIEHNKKVCNNCKFIFYDDKDCEQLIKNNFNDEIFNNYKRINPTYGAMRADFFRYCVLYLYGGIYIDIKSKINYPIFKIINNNDICILDIPRTYKEAWRVNSPTYEQWLLIFAPSHPYLLTMLNLMCKYISEKYIPISINGISLSTKGKVLNITGPDAFTKAINNYISNNNKILHRNLNYDYFSNLNYSINYKKMYKMNNKKHYSEVKEPFYMTF
jgi:mannosyltransferase OCH1-like enzyme